MKLVKQTNRFNCGSACLAMVLGTTVEECEERYLKRKVGELKDPKDGETIGVTAMEINCILNNNGFCTLEMFSPKYQDDWYYGRVHEDMPSVDFLEQVNDHIMSGGTAIVAVPSLGSKDGHWVVIDKMKVLDPSTGNTYDEEIDPENPLEAHVAILICEKNSQIT